MKTGASDTMLDLAAMLRSGALGEGISMIRKGFSEDGILKQFEQDYPMAPADTRKQAYTFCLRCVAAADVVMALSPGFTPGSRTFPKLPE